MLVCLRCSLPHPFHFLCDYGFLGADTSRGPNLTKMGYQKTSRVLFFAPLCNIIEMK